MMHFFHWALTVSAWAQCGGEAETQVVGLEDGAAQGFGQRTAHGGGVGEDEMKKMRPLGVLSAVVVFAFDRRESPHYWQAKRTARVVWSKHKRVALLLPSALLLSGKKKCENEIGMSVTNFVKTNSLSAGTASEKVSHEKM
jgi:hypothetical protein